MIVSDGPVLMNERHEKEAELLPHVAGVNSKVVLNINMQKVQRRYSFIKI
jgi:hypothetical protein